MLILDKSAISKIKIILINFLFFSIYLIGGKANSITFNMCQGGTISANPDISMSLTDTDKDKIAHGDFLAASKVGLYLDQTSSDFKEAMEVCAGTLDEEISIDLLPIT